MAQKLRYKYRNAMKKKDGIFKKLFIYLFLENGQGRERERNIDVPEKCRLAASCTPPTGDLAHNPAGPQPRHVSGIENAQPIEPHQSERDGII